MVPLKYDSEEIISRQKERNGRKRKGKSVGEDLNSLRVGSKLKFKNHRLLKTMERKCVSKEAGKRVKKRQVKISLRVENKEKKKKGKNREAMDH